MGYYPQESLYKPYKYHGYTVWGTPNCPLIFRADRFECLSKALLEYWESVFCVFQLDICKNQSSKNILRHQGWLLERKQQQQKDAATEESIYIIYNIIYITCIKNNIYIYTLVQKEASLKAFHCFGEQYTQELCNRIMLQNVLCQQVDVKELLLLCNNMCFFNQLM